MCEKEQPSRTKYTEQSHRFVKKGMLYIFVETIEVKWNELMGQKYAIGNEIVIALEFQIDPDCEWVW